MAPGLLSNAHLPSFLFGALLSTQISADICCAQLPGARFSLHYEHGARVFFIHRNVQFFISCTYTCNKKQKQKTKKAKQPPKNIGANSYI